MNNKTWLWYVNLLALVILVFTCIALAIALATGEGLGFIIGGVGMVPLAIIIVTIIVLVGFPAVLVINFLMPPKDKSGWLVLTATILFVPAALCLVGLSVFASALLVSITNK